SADTVLSGDDISLASIVRNDPLAAGASYELDLTVTLPLSETLLSGTYFLLASIDDANRISESDENNVYASAALEVDFPPLVDLLPTS
ncbi:CARDB domain-containing protein, partial [Priestia megaterium]|uniref:CARDB domain-containing protein n=1 Tax=Priestia megaterium TaxID=1404 RepID=UPI0035B662B2